MVGIYKITSPSGKVYIGQSWDIKIRYQSYMYNPSKNQRYLYRSIKKYGWNLHTFEVIHELPEDVTQEVLNNYEILYWQLYKDVGTLMLNIKEPGSNGRHSDETKELMRIKATGRIMPIGSGFKSWLTKLKNNTVPNTKGSSRPNLQRSINKTIHTFLNPITNQTFTGTRYAFSKQYNLFAGNIHKLINGQSVTLKGWRLYAE